MPKRGENIRKRKDGRWEGRYVCDRNENGNAKYRSVYAKSYSEVRQMLYDAKGGTTPPKRSRSVAITFGDVSAQWLTGCSLRLKHSTVVKYTTLLDNHILPRFRNVNLSLNSDDSIAEFVREKSSELSNSTIRSLLTTINQF